MAVGNICTREVDTVDPDESVYLAAERMLERAGRHVSRRERRLSNPLVS